MRRQVETGEEPRVGMTFIGLSSVLLLPPMFHLLKALQLLKQYQGIGTGESKMSLWGTLKIQNVTKDLAHSVDSRSIVCALCVCVHACMCPCMCSAHVEVTVQLQVPPPFFEKALSLA